MKLYNILILLITSLFLLLPTLLFAQMEWICTTDSAGWEKRYGHISINFNNRIWVIGGCTSLWPPIFKNDVWYSQDGINWICATDSAAWSARFFHTSVVFDNKIWIIGGSDSIDDKNDVWYSVDGINWIQTTDSAGWSKRGGHTSVVFNNKIWILGGFQLPGSFKNDVWYSSDGINWFCATGSAGWLPRYGHTSVVYDNIIYLFGGVERINCKKDVWYSQDGINWICATDSAAWSERYLHTSIIFENKKWILGGINVGSHPKNDVWFSYDCLNWICATDSADWPIRAGHSSCIFENKIWVLGGCECPGFQLLWNDVWYSTGLGIGEERTMFNTKRIIPEIYPNPARSFLTIRLPYSADRRLIKIFDVSGKMVREIASASGFASQSIGTRSALRNDEVVEISLKGINPGIYFLRLGKETKKLLVVE